MRIKVLLLTFCAVAWPAASQTVFNINPTRSFGQPRLIPVTTANPNLVEGRELYSPLGVALDTSASPPIVYVADTYNDRVLAWKNSAGFNNGDLADLVIGQKDLYSTLRGGPNTALSSGLFLPVAVAVDPKGNLYVADAGNNRIVRYPAPFGQTSTPVLADLVIGQPSVGVGQSPNQGLSAPSSSTLYLSNGNILNSGLAFDPQGNLWVTDSGNNRVMRFNASALSAGGTVSADLVLGQADFVSNGLPSSTLPVRYSKGILVQPYGIAVAPSGDIFVSDRGARVLYFKGPVSASGTPATRILGVVVPTKSQPNPAALNGCPATPPELCEVTLGAQTSSGISPAYGLAVVTNHLFVADTANNRVVEYDTPDKWQSECPYNPAADCGTGLQFSPTPIAYFGQGNNGQAVKVNNGQREPSATTLFGPTGLAGAGGDLWVADSANNRVLVFPGASATAARVLGQYNVTMNAPNLVEGRELFTFGGVTAGLVTGGAGIAVDYKSNHLYVADTNNNRILGFSDYRKVQPGVKADIVIGQRDLNHTTPNSFGADGSTPTSSSLLVPEGITVDLNGDLWVADLGNGRVLRFPQPFKQQGTITANVVLGKSSFTIKNADQSDATKSTMRAPYGIATTASGSVAVSDRVHDRVLVFNRPSGGDFVNTQPADTVIGQPDFVSSAPGSDQSTLDSPRGLAIDSSNRLYVADGGNNRVQVFSLTSPTATLTIPAASPHDVAVSLNTGEIWVTDLSSVTVNGQVVPGRVVRYPVYEQLALNPGQNISILPEPVPFAVKLDPFDNPIIADSYNRIVFFFPAAIFKNSGSYSSLSLTPGMLALVGRLGPSFVSASWTAPGTPWLATSQDLEVTVNGTPAPIYYIDSTYSALSIQVPSNAPTSGFADFVITRPSTGQVLAAASLPMNVAAPSFFTKNAVGTGQIAALNILHADGSAYPPGSRNGSNSPIEVGGYVQLYGTGIGPVSGAPPDGQGATGAVPAPVMPTVFIGAQQATVQYFGLAPTLPGVFAMNVQVPAGAPPGDVKVGFFYQNIQSTFGPPGQNGQPTLLSTTINVQ
jgi:uncharacterized protein (TIGR03437 family)